jgi:hypothetical protein
MEETVMARFKHYDYGQMKMPYGHGALPRGLRWISTINLLP